MADRCDAELCPMWDGDGCPCDTFGLDRDDLPTDGTFTVEHRAGADRGEHASDRPTTPITDTPEDFARALGITPEENPNA